MNFEVQLPLCATKTSIAVYILPLIALRIDKTRCYRGMCVSAEFSGSGQGNSSALMSVQLGKCPAVLMLEELFVENDKAY
jgi:hypothetical protein